MALPRLARLAAIERAHQGRRHGLAQQFAVQPAQRVALDAPGGHPRRKGRIASHGVLDLGAAFRCQLAIDEGMQLVVAGGRSRAIHDGAAGFT